MDEGKKEPFDFLKLIAEVELKAAFKQMRLLYLGLIEAGFTMQEAMAYLAALTRNPSNDKKG
jgi:hypothetical protein